MDQNLGLVVATILFGFVLPALFAVAVLYICFAFYTYSATKNLSISHKIFLVIAAAYLVLYIIVQRFI